MRVAIVHYHLHSGGATRVIESSIEALKGSEVDVCVLSGEPYKGDMLPCVGVVPELAYTEGRATNFNAADLVSGLRTQAKALLGSPPDLWHIHNPTLGKNGLLLDALHSLAESGESMLLHIHDFPEDGRPANYRYLKECAAEGNGLYPVGKRVAYAVLNERDYSILLQAGMPEASLFLLPNPVKVPSLEDARCDLFSENRLVLYSTRGIRRKNIGELLLWSTNAADGDLYASSLGPLNPLARSIHESWVRCADRLHLPVKLALGDEGKYTFLDLVASADALITTSIAEGFGLSFLEPCLWGKPLMGRDLPEITQGFKDSGIALYSLYTRLPVPLAWFDKAALKRDLLASFQRHLEAYEVFVESIALGDAWNRWTEGGVIDFGRLNEGYQMNVVERSSLSPSAREDLGLNLDEDRSVVDYNRAAILEHYNVSVYAERLKSAYRSVVNAESSTMVDFDPSKVLQAFLNPQYFSMLRSL